ncbi:FtsX-like permease family protein [Streptomyces sp. NPDC059002]|uniref:ABC transporter permease n=1 Tax=Streptomyces sp. NPDC059002 TaxID=3346690 RepID=UPI0036AE1C88
MSDPTSPYTTPSARTRTHRTRKADAVGLLAARAARTHRKAWAAVFAALALTSLLLGTFGLALASAGLGHARVERYAAADLVVTGDQNTRYTATPWGSDPETATAGLTERVRVPEAAADAVRKVPGVRAVIADEVFHVGVRGEEATGRPWPAARLAPYALREGTAPKRPSEIVVGAGTARVGATVTVRTAGSGAAYQVVGTAEGPRASVYFTSGEAHRLAGRPGSVAALGVTAAPGTSTSDLYARVRHALDAKGLHAVGHRADGDGAGLRVLTGNGRGGAEFLAVAPARSGLLAMLASVAATVVLIALLVVSSTVVQALQQRGRELGLLRAVGATPRQLRGAVGREVGRVAARAALTGAAAAVPAYLGLRALLDARGALPPGLELPLPPWLLPAPLVTAALTLLVARVAALIACARTAKVRPAEALRETAPGNARRITGLVLLFLGMSSAGTATLQHGEAAAAAAGAAAVVLVIGCAVLGPWIAEGALRILGTPLRRIGGPAGRLAAANSLAMARRSGAAITPIILVTAFIAVQLSAGATLTHAAGTQADDAARATFALTTPGGLSAQDLKRVRETPGVTAATGVTRSTVVLARRETGSPRLDRLPVLGVTPKGLTHTLDPGIRSGDIGALRPGTVAVGRDQARSLDVRPGSKVTLRFGDGVEARLTVVAVYDRQLALGAFLFSHEQLTRHLSSPAHGRILVTSKGTTPRTLRAAAPGARITPRPGPERTEPEDQALGEVVTMAAVGAIGGFTAIAVLSTLSLIAIGRRPELSLLRLAGAGRRQLRRMLRLEAAAMALTGLTVGAAVASVPLLAFSMTAAHSLPHLPPTQAALLTTLVAATTYAGTLLPSRPPLRDRYPHPSSARRDE